MKNGSIEHSMVRGHHCLTIRPPEVRTDIQLVFLHDALGSVEQWGSFPEKLAERCGTVAFLYDRMGHGRSGPYQGTRTSRYLHDEALDVLPALLRELKVENPLLIGHSDGGTIALLYGAHHPCSGLITEAAHAFVEEKTQRGIREAISRESDLVEKLRGYHGDKVTALFGAWPAIWLDPGHASWNILEELESVSCPVLVIQGREDRYGTDAQVTKIVRTIGPSARALFLEGVGHSPHQSEEALLLEKMAGFISGIIAKKERVS